MVEFSCWKQSQSPQCFALYGHSGSIDDLITIKNTMLGQAIGKIHPRKPCKESTLEDGRPTDLDWMLESKNGPLWLIISMCDKCEDFQFETQTLSHLDSNVPLVTRYGEYFGRACGKHSDFLSSHRWSTQNLTRAFNKGSCCKFKQFYHAITQASVATPAPRSNI